MSEDMVKRVLPDSLSRSSFVPSTVHLVVILPPSGGQSPSPPTFGGVYRKARAAALGLRVFGRFCQNGKNGQKHLRPRRCLPKGSVFRALFLGLFFFKINFILKIKN